MIEIKGGKKNADAFLLPEISELSLIFYYFNLDAFNAWLILPTFVRLPKKHRSVDNFYPIKIYDLPLSQSYC